MGVNLRGNVAKNYQSGKNKVQTLCIIHQENNILLGMKKKGFGRGRWNGFGGNLEEEETLEAAALREVEEEAGIIPLNLQKRGILTFKSGNNINEVHVFSATSFNGEIKETEEMSPQWFPKNKIPFQKMWPSDRHWFPLFLEGKNFRGHFLFDETDSVIDHNLEEIIEF